jgi:two-component system cell cycle sensor histidine kinase/response regulator CckA
MKTDPVSVLVVDDDSGMRALARRILEPAGYHVVEAAGGVSGVLLLQAGVPIDLVIADLNMPSMPGEEMVRQVRKLLPDLKVLYVTAHIDRLMDHRLLWEGEAFLDKPYTSTGLLEAVSLLLTGTLKRRRPGA